MFNFSEDSIRVIKTALIKYQMEVLMLEDKQPENKKIKEELSMINIIIDYINEK